MFCFVVIRSVLAQGTTSVNDLRFSVSFSTVDSLYNRHIMTEILSQYFSHNMMIVASYTSLGLSVIENMLCF